MTSILLIGTGNMGLEYAKVLRDGLHIPFTACARNRDRLTLFVEQQGAVSGIPVADLTAQHVSSFDAVIVAASVESLADLTRHLLDLGARALLVEKPGVLSVGEARQLARLAEQKAARVRIATNRRFYQSVQLLKRLLQTEPPACASFDFTEVAWQVPDLPFAPHVKARWAIANSVHVIDTVAYLFGEFKDLQAQVTGPALDWHPVGSTFVGSGRCGTTPVSWATSWACPGRWDIQAMTAAGRYKLSPMERLQVIRPRTFQWVEVEADYLLDTQFKPGLHAMVSHFLEGGTDLPDLTALARTLEQVSALVGYPN